jgi:hypothetical protein
VLASRPVHTTRTTRVVGESRRAELGTSTARPRERVRPARRRGKSETLSLTTLPGSAAGCGEDTGDRVDAVALIAQAWPFLGFRQGGIAKRTSQCFRRGSRAGRSSGTPAVTETDSQIGGLGSPGVPRNFGGLIA